MRTRVLIAALVAVAPAMSWAGSGADHPYFDSKHTIVVGGTWQDADTELRATRGNLPEVTLDLDDLGIDDSDNSWMLEYRYRINDKWAVSAGAFQWSATGSIAAERDFNFGGVEFTAGAEVSSRLEVDTYIIDVMYSLSRGENYELLVGGGLHAFDLTAEIKGEAFVGDDINVEGSSASDDLLAPLPNIRGQFFYSFSDRWAAMATLGWLSANVDDWDGDFLYTHARVGYRITDHLTFGVGYQYTEVDLKEEKSRGENEYKIQFTGPTAQLVYRF
jgi:opacity protein-like surface antigen